MERHKEWYRGEMWKRVTEHYIVSSVIGALLFLFTAYPVFFGDEPLWSVLNRKGWALTMPSWYHSFVLLLGCVVVILQVVLIRTAFRHRQEVEGTLTNPAAPNEETKSEALKYDDPLENTEQKERFRLFTQQVMRRTCSRMQHVANQVHGTLFNGPVSTREGRLLRYSVDAYLFFIQPLGDREEILRDFLSARESLNSPDFPFAQRLFVDLYNTYEHRQPWVRDMAWETLPNFSTAEFFQEWKKADYDMREELIKLTRDCPVLRDNIMDLNLPTPRRWEKGGS